MPVPEVARRQHGAFTSGQAAQAGIAPAALRHALGRGVLERPYRGVFVDVRAGAGALTAMSAALLSCGPSAVLGGGAAAELHRLPVATVPAAAVCVLVPRSVNARSRPGREVHRSRFVQPPATTLVHGLRVLSLPRLVVALCGELPETERLALIAQLVQQRRCSLGQLRDAVRRYGRLAGARELAAALAAVAPGRQSALEIELARWLSSAGLPEPLCNAPVPTAAGTVHPDFFWPPPRVAIEAQGAEFHLGHRDWQRDLQRLEALRAVGVEVIQVTWAQLQHDRDALFEAVASTLRRRWPAQTSPFERRVRTRA